MNPILVPDPLRTPPSSRPHATLASPIEPHMAMTYWIAQGCLESGSWVETW